VFIVAKRIWHIFVLFGIFWNTIWHILSLWPWQHWFWHTLSRFTGVLRTKSVDVLSATSCCALRIYLFPLCPLLTSLLLRLQFAVLLVRLIYLICLALLRPKSPIFGPNFASMMFPVLQALDAIVVPTTSYSHLCCAQTGPLQPENSSGCLVLYIACIFSFSAVCVSYLLLFATMSIFGRRPAPPYSHTSFRIFSPATFQRIHALSPVSISGCLRQTTMCSSATFLTLLSLLPFDSAFCSTTQHLAYGPAPVFVCLPATTSFLSCLFVVICSARHL